MSVQRARSADEYIEWVRQAVFEVGDLLRCSGERRHLVAVFERLLEEFAAGSRGGSEDDQLHGPTPMARRCL